MIRPLITGTALAALSAGAWAQEPGATGTQPAPKPANGAFTKAELAKFELFERRNPFSPTPERKPVTKPETKPETKPVPPPVKQRETRDEISKNLTVTSVVIPRDGGSVPVAIVEEDGEAPRQLKRGDTFLKGTVSAVTMDGITVLIEDKPRTIPLGEPFADGTKTHKVYVDTGERVDGGGAASRSGGSSDASSSGGSSPKKPGGVSSLLTEAERNLPDAERRKLLIQRMKERREQQRKEKGK